MRSGHFDVQFWLSDAANSNALRYVIHIYHIKSFSSSSLLSSSIVYSYAHFSYFLFHTLFSIGYNPGYGHFSHLNNRFGYGSTQNYPYYYSNYAQPFSAYTLNRHQQPLANGYVGVHNQPQVHIFYIYPPLTI